MAANAAFTINDGTDDHVYSPSGIVDNTASFQDKSVAYIPGRETAVLKRREPEKGPVREVTMSVRIPKVVTETINGVDVPRVASFGTGIAKMLVPKDWTPTEIGVLRAVLAGLPSAAPFVAAADENEWVW